MTDLYDQRIDAMKARESWFTEDVIDQDDRNIERLAVYKRKRAEHG